MMKNSFSKKKKKNHNVKFERKINNLGAQLTSRLLVFLRETFMVQIFIPLTIELPKKNGKKKLACATSIQLPSNSIWF